MLKSVLMFGSDFSFLCTGSWWFWWEFTFFPPQRRGSEKSFCSPRMIVCSFWPFPVIHIVGCFAGLFSQAIRSTGCGMVGGILAAPTRSSLLTGLGGPALVPVPFPCSACESLHLMILSPPNAALQRINFSGFFFLNLQKYLVLQLVISAKLLIRKYILLAAFLK